MPPRQADPLYTVAAAVSAVVLAAMTAPLVVTVVTAFNATEQTVFPPDGWSLRWFANIFRVPQFGAAFRFSLALAVASSAAAMTLGTLAALAIVRHRFPGRAFVDTILMSPIIVPQIIVGLAFLIFYTRAGSRATFVNLLVLHTVLALPYAVRVIVASLARVNASLEEAAVGLGASPIKAFLLVTVPQIRAGLFAAGFFTFVISFDNFTATLFLTQYRATLPIEMFNYIQSEVDPTISAIATLMLVGTVVFVVVIERLVGLQRITS